MKKMFIVMAWLIIALAVACSAAPTINTKAPTATTEPPPATPTPSPVAEWAVERISVNGDTVIVSIFLHSTASIEVTVDGNPPTRRDDNLPTLSYIFENVAPGDQQVVIRDTMGNMEVTSAFVEELPVDNSIAEWLAEWLVELEANEMENPPRSITRYEYQGETVYYVVMQCCDQFSDLLDANGNLIGHPDGGITGRGDGSTVFNPTGLKGEEIWTGR